jgi:ABC-type uncharacterized transport system ATPase subunit
MVRSSRATPWISPSDKARYPATIMYNGRQVDMHSPQEAAALGVGMVHQHFSLIDPLTVWENVVLGDQGRVDRKAACAQVRDVAQRYGLPIDPMARIDRLSAGERQRVELIKCLRRDPSILILDEPTSVLTQAESAELFTVLRRVVQSENRAVILISHKLAEITAATDEVTVLRRGRVVFTTKTSQTTAQELARQMVGRDVSLKSEAAALGILPVEHTDVAAIDTTQRPSLKISDLHVRIGGVNVLDGLDLTVYPGEILGLYGVEGNGQSTLGDVLSGLIPTTSGTIEINGTAVDPDKAGAFTQAGLGIVPEDRHRSGVVLDMTIAENLAMKSLDTVSGRSLMNRKKLAEQAERLVKEFNIITPSVYSTVRSLSGGNQQRVVLARELSCDPQVLVAAQPTHGLDVGAIEDMYVRLRKVAASGVAVLLISTELEEVMALSSRIAVISSGRISGLLTANEATSERLGMLVGGVAA